MFRCSACGRDHDEDEVSFASPVPLQWGLLRPEERAASDITDDVCIISSSEGLSFYVRCSLEIPILGSQQTYSWGVWCSISEASMREMHEHWDGPERAHMGHYFGWLCTSIPTYPDTAFLKASVQQRPPGLRPLVELHPCDHPLVVDQRQGMERQRLQSILAKLWHADGPTAD